MGSFEASEETVKFLCDRLVDQTQPISERFRALFSLRNLKGNLPRNALILGNFRPFFLHFLLLLGLGFLEFSHIIDCELFAT